MLEWYDQNARKIPWRALPGQAIDPYHVWLSEIMCQQTTVAAVIPYFLKFIQKWPTVFDLAAADKEEIMAEWAGLGYYARARNVQACAKIIAYERDGLFPDNQDDLKKLPGIGEYTAAAIAAIAFGKSAIVIDGNIERIAARVFAITDPLPKSKPAIKKAAALLFQGSTERPGDFAQSLMDLGAGVCIPKTPKCMICPVNSFCKAYKAGIAASLPMREKVKSKPQRHGIVYWIEDGAGHVLLERRPETAMLGGMIGLPTSEWVDPIHPAHHPAFVHMSSKPLSEKVYHSFTHFDLSLLIIKASAHENKLSENHYWQSLSSLDERHMPTLFRKTFRLANPRI